MNIAGILMEKKNRDKKDVGFGNNIKDSREFSYKILFLLKSKFERISKLFAIKNAANIVSLIIINIFMDYFI